MNRKKLKLAGLFMIVLCLNLISTIDLNAQTQKQKARDKARMEAEKKAADEEAAKLAPQVKKEKPLTKEEKIAKRKKVNKTRNLIRASKNTQMYEKLAMTDDQIKKYEEMNEKFSNATSKAMKKNADNKEKLQKEMQKISEEKNAALASIFKGDQFTQYEIYQEDEATNRTSKKHKHKVKNLPSSKK